MGGKVLRFPESAIFDEGMNEGRAEGERIGKESVALRMLKAGKLALEDIAEYSGLTVGAVMALQRRMA